MENLIKQIKNAYRNNCLKEISKLSKKFAKMITINLMEKNFEDLKELCFYSADAREDIEIECNVKKDANYYLGYIYAYENIARRLMRSEESNLKIEQILAQDARAIKIMAYLNSVKFASHKEIAEHIEMSTTNLSNFFKKELIVESKIFESNKIGRTKYYYLTSLGKEFLGNKHLQKDVDRVINLLQLNIESVNVMKSENKIEKIDESLDYGLGNSYEECCDYEVYSEGELAA
ncbi:hypothetical protein [Clostridium mediterraneense]|uniref:hypothetical protein n=1 Tax=Clostridium mediterraneense TaxID=1805472 RepID=UPI00082AAFB0|nr:hypothetical protein [Clostridium mediterraneense]